MSKRSVALRRRIVLALIVTAFALVGYAVYTLRVEEIRVTGLDTLDAAEVVEAAKLRGGERILWIRMSAVARRVEAIPAVDSATAERSFPGTVVIRVEERAPVARLAGHAALAVDDDGRVFTSPVAGVLPEVEGARGRARPGGAVDEGAARILSEFVRFPPALRQQAARLVVGPPFTLVLRSGIEVRFGAHEELAHKAAAAVAVLAAEQGRELAYIDVRAPNVPAAKEKDPPTPAPTPVPTARPAPAPTPRTDPPSPAPGA